MPQCPFDNAMTRSDYDRAFLAVMADIGSHVSCRKTWRLAASMGRCDVLIALLGQAFSMSEFNHALHWCAPEARPVLDAFADAMKLQDGRLPPPTSSTITRL